MDCYIEFRSRDGWYFIIKFGQTQTLPSYSNKTEKAFCPTMTDYQNYAVCLRQAAQRGCAQAGRLRLDSFAAKNKHSWILNGWFLEVADFWSAVKKNYRTSLDPRLKKTLIMCLSEGFKKTESTNSEEVLVTVIRFQDKKSGFVE